MEKISNGVRGVSCLALALCGVLVAGCANAGTEHEEMPDVETKTAKRTGTEATIEESGNEGDAKPTAQIRKKNTLTAEQADAYQQMTLYIQEGFRTYEVEGTYQAYFQEIEKLDDGTFECSILLEGKETDELWSEEVAYSYDEENAWYTFEGIFEPIFTKDPFEGVSEDSDFVKEVRKNHVYSAEIAKKKDISAPIHYISENGPVERDMWKRPPDSEWVDRYVRTYLYTYYDDRLDIDITIEYPQLSLSSGYDELEEKINTKLKNAVFFPYGYKEGESVWNPLDEAYADITRNYVITREDENYFSMRIFEDNYYRGANHPNQFERGLTINMKTGEVLRLQDVVGSDRTPMSLLDTGAFHCLWVWKDGNESDEEAAENWMNQLHDSWFHMELSSWDPYFYLTQDGLGLITEISRYYTPIEATFADLGLEPEIATVD